MVYIYIYMCCKFISSRSAWKILWTRLKKENGRLGNKPWRSLDELMMMKMAADSKSKGKNTGYIRHLHGQ